jgi:hypothetical protein
MQKRILIVLVGLLGLTGCAHHYVVRLSNGQKISTSSKPKLDQGVYHFKDAAGKTRYVSAGRVAEIVPASMAKDEKEPFKPNPMPH